MGSESLKRHEKNIEYEPSADKRGLNGNEDDGKGYEAIAGFMAKDVDQDLQKIILDCSGYSDYKNTECHAKKRPANRGAHGHDKTECRHEGGPFVDNNDTKSKVILQVIPELDSGGAEQSAIDIANALTGKGFENYIWSKGGRMVAKLKAPDQVHIQKNVKSKNPFVIIGNAFKLAAFIKRRGVRIIHARSRAPAWSAWLAAKMTGITYVTTFHATYNYKNSCKKCYNSVMVRTPHIIANSMFIKNHIIKHYGVVEDNITVIHRGVQDLFFEDIGEGIRTEKLEKAWGLQPSEKVILVPARLTRWKGQESVIKALGLVRNRDFKCVFLGGHQGREDYYQQLQNLAEEVGVGNKVYFANHCDDMKAAYTLADVVISSSIEDEAFGRVIVEAQACGKPVIVTKVGAYKETSLQDETGFWINPNDPKGMAGKIDEVLDFNEKKRHDVQTKAVSFVRAHYTAQQMAEKTLEVYQRV